mmetsp:Transcript_64954/g.108836  ORF Transcript_64954/g.108836 Transcript_64954/m.108836 type:complete len:111 (+) Transcript_64954:303-635(+)
MFLMTCWPTLLLHITAYLILQNQLPFCGCKIGWQSEVRCMHNQKVKAVVVAVVPFNATKYAKKKYRAAKQITSAAIILYLSLPGRKDPKDPKHFAWTPSTQSGEKLQPWA